MRNPRIFFFFQEIVYLRTRNLDPIPSHSHGHNSDYFWMKSRLLGGSRKLRSWWFLVSMDIIFSRSLLLFFFRGNTKVTIILLGPVLVKQLMNEAWIIRSSVSVLETGISSFSCSSSSSSSSFFRLMGYKLPECRKGYGTLHAFTIIIIFLLWEITFK